MELDYESDERGYYMSKKQRVFQPEVFQQEIMSAPSKISEPSEKKKRGVGVTIVFPEPIYEGLRAYTYHERKKINPLVLDLTTHFLKEKGYLT